MSQGAQTPPSDAREASMSRVTTLDAVLAKAAPADPPIADPSQEEPKPKDEPKPKKGFNERISEVIAQRKEFEEKAAKAEREAEELRAKLEALSVKAEPSKLGDKPARTGFTSDEDYIEALADWKAKQAIAGREKEQAEAQAKAEYDAIERSWSKQCEAAKAELDDFETVIADSDVSIPDVVAAALKESEHGAKLMYFLAKHPVEASLMHRMRPIAAVKHLAKLEAELMEPEAVEPKRVERSKAPEPMTPVKQSLESGSRRANESYEEYRARRQAERSDKRR
jgi:hypothetical protein